MRHLVVLSAATIVAAFGLSGCSSGSPAPASSPRTSAAPQAQFGALPDPAALTDVLSKLTDGSVPGSAKLPLVEGATSDEAAEFDRFTKALQDNHMLPLTFAATNLVWSDDEPANVTASVAVTPADPAAGAFTFPMEFKPAGAGWQLSRRTTDLLLSVGGNAPTGPAPTPTR